MEATIVLVHVTLQDKFQREDLAEFQELVRSAGIEQTLLVTGTRVKPDVKYFVGQGKAEEIRGAVEASQASLVIFNHTLFPSQQRNLEKLCDCQVLDRTGLILDIFAQHARSFEGKLQVELAQLEHMATRLVGGWTHLERQKGGIGLRGPGETQLETDRRLIRNRIKTIRKRLIKVESQRDQSRHARQRAEVPLVSLVGYTNAGKSTLFNVLTGATEYVANQLFATLDTTIRRAELVTLGPMVFADTVGFIHNLPHTLVAAFRATLEETCEADLLLHVIDASNEEYLHQMMVVEGVLETIGGIHVPRLEVYNKIDRIPECIPRLERDASNRIIRVWISSLTGAGLDLLRLALIEQLNQKLISPTLQLPPAIAGAFRAKFYRLGVISKEETSEKGDTILTLCIEKRRLESIFKNEELDWQMYLVGGYNPNGLERT